MADAQSKPARDGGNSGAFIRGAGEVYDPEHKLWGPVKWVAQLVQYLVAIVIVTIGEAFKSIVSGERPRNRRHPRSA